MISDMIFTHGKRIINRWLIQWLVKSKALLSKTMYLYVLLFHSRSKKTDTTKNILGKECKSVDTAQVGILYLIGIN